MERCVNREIDEKMVDYKSIMVSCFENEKDLLTREN